MAQAISFLAGVVMGTCSTITTKIMYGLEAVGTTGNVQRFEKPLFMTFAMFVAMSLALPIYGIVQWNRRKSGKGKYSLIGAPTVQDDTSEEITNRTLILLSIPAALDLLATALASVGLLFTTVSVFQLVRCSVI
ncbi:MAG: hypothetical protein O7C62_08730, partial [Rickettsia endosymbiont of Ixodes persulcatus]|nr:hypothetical protein [Rickettsia endosymbiont of Ixodes persulcatus]